MFCPKLISVGFLFYKVLKLSLVSGSVRLHFNHFGCCLLAVKNAALKIIFCYFIILSSAINDLYSLTLLFLYTLRLCLVIFAAFRKTALNIIRVLAVDRHLNLFTSLLVI